MLLVLIFLYTIFH